MTLHNLVHRFHFIYTLNLIGRSLQDLAIQKVLQREHQLVEEENTHRIEGNTKDDTTPWLRFTQWKETFRGKDLKVMKTI